MKNLRWSVLLLSGVIALAIVPSAGAISLAGYAFDPRVDGQMSWANGTYSRKATIFHLDLTQPVYATDLTFWGYYGTGTTPASSVFRIELYNNLSTNLPDASPFYSMSTTLSGLGTGQYLTSQSSKEILSFSTALSPHTFTATGDYWLSVAMVSTIEPSWLWCRGADQSTRTAARGGDTGSWSNGGTHYPYAFAMEGSPVPEPGAAALLVVGLAGVMALRRHRAGR